MRYIPRIEVSIPLFPFRLPRLPRTLPLPSQKLTHVLSQRSVLLLLLYYIDRICACLQHFIISSLTVHRFILTSVTLASKAFCDAFATNPQFARVGGVSLIELNLLEKEFLAVLDWRLAVSFTFGLVTPRILRMCLG